MDELDLPSSETPAKKTRKTPVKRVRSRAASAEPDAPAAPVADSSEPSVVEAAVSTGEDKPRQKRVRTRRGRSTSGDGLPTADAASAGAGDAPSGELFTSVDAADPADLPAAAPGEGGRMVYSFSPDPEPDSPAPGGAGEERPVFVPHGREGDSAATGATSADGAAPVPGSGTSGDADSATGAASSSQPDQGGGRREDKKSWWERKKEKKRQKWLERQAAGGGGGGGGGNRPDRPDRPERERNPAQPPPPSLQGPVGALPADERLADPAALDALADELAKDAEPLDLAAIHAAPAGDLAQRLRALGETVAGMPPRRALVEQLFAWAARGGRALRESGVLDLTDAGHGFVTQRVNSYRLYPESTYVPASLVKRHGLRRGQEIDILAQAPKPGERCPSAVRILSVMGTTPEQARNVTVFEELTPYYPTARILVEAPEIHKDISMRAVDLLTPIGFGQRGLIVAPPRTGKTTLLRDMAVGVLENHPECQVMILLVDERPEEVTDFRRNVAGAEVWASSNDDPVENHIRVADLAIERARRLVEVGRDVVLFIDSLTRLSRAHNTAKNSGRTGSGGLDVRALEKPRQLFASARRTEEAGSLTIIASILVETGSRMDDVIFQEFKGTGNSDLILDRKCAELRLWPAVNIQASGTRKEELLVEAKRLETIHFFRRALVQAKIEEACETAISRLAKTKTNDEFIKLIGR